jgi:hypothetical protein
LKLRQYGRDVFSLDSIPEDSIAVTVYVLGIIAYGVGIVHATRLPNPWVESLGLFFAIL